MSEVSLQAEVPFQRTLFSSAITLSLNNFCYENVPSITKNKLDDNVLCPDVTKVKGSNPIWALIY